MSRASRLGHAIVALPVIAACGGGNPASTADCYTGAPAASATSESGALAMDVRTCPQPPARGTNTVELTVRRTADGGPVDGLTLEVAPFMPAMNHGTSAPTITPEGGGKYLVTEVYLYMPGVWQLRTTFSGPVSDHAAPSVSVP